MDLLQKQSELREDVGHATLKDRNKFAYMRMIEMDLSNINKSEAIKDSLDALERKIKQTHNAGATIQYTDKSNPNYTVTVKSTFDQEGKRNGYEIQIFDIDPNKEAIGVQFGKSAGRGTHTSIKFDLNKKAIEAVTSSASRSERNHRAIQTEDTGKYFHMINLDIIHGKGPQYSLPSLFQLERVLARK
jgi:hypothetical protein